MLENTEGAIKMENPDKLETQGTQYEDKQNKTTTHYVLDTTTLKQTQIDYALIRYGIESIYRLYHDQIYKSNQSIIYST
jgi:hypothetical protein